MTRAQQRAEALRILRGCDRGATEASLAIFGVTRPALEDLVRAGQVKTRDAHMAAPAGMVVRWYSINPTKGV